MRKIALFCMLLLSAYHLYAQEDVQSSRMPYTFVSVQGGALYTYDGRGIDRTWAPMGAISFGHYVSDVIGFRLQGSGAVWNAKLKGKDKFKSKLASADLDVLLNLSNGLLPDRNNFINVIAVLGAQFGLPLTHTWLRNYEQAETSSDKWNVAWRGGGIIEFNMAKNWAIALEGGASYIHTDKEMAPVKSKWWPYAMAGITYKFGHRKPKPKTVQPTSEVFMQETADDSSAEMASAPISVSEKKEQKVVKPAENITPTPETKVETEEATVPKTETQNIYFTIGSATITSDGAAKIDAMAELIRKSQAKEGKLSVTGYADKETGNAQINKTLSERRASAVRKALSQRGIDMTHASVEGKGDTIQPFANNDENRVVIIEYKSK